MPENSREAILADIRKTLQHAPGAPPPPAPRALPPRAAAASEEEIEKLVTEINALKGWACRLNRAAVPQALADLVKNESIRRAVTWNTPGLAQLGVRERLRGLGVEVIPHDAEKQVMAEAELGITEADFALPETGTIALLSSPDKPRSVSLLPRVHLAILHSSALRADLHEVFAEAKNEGYLIFITGPSRTSDIELITTIGVHGPRSLYVWILE